MLPGEECLTVVPVGAWIYVERIRKTVTDGGILIPQTFDHKHSAARRLNAVADHFMVRVLATGPEVPRSEASGLEQGDHALVWSYAEGSGERLWTGESSGERDRMFVKPSDIVCAVDP